MTIIIFSIAALVLISLVVYFTLKRKIKCHQCFSHNVIATGKKRYNEDPVAVVGSPNPFYELEYKCNSCGSTFWEPKPSAIFN
jgi:hypothetical protein